MSEDFSRALRERVDALQPRIDVDTSHVISGARRRRTLRRSAVTTVVLTAIVVLVVALSAQPWTSWTSTPPAATPTVPTELVAPEGTYWHTVSRGQAGTLLERDGSTYLFDPTSGLLLEYTALDARIIYLEQDVTHTLPTG